jgi:hypothetical protein
MLRRNKNSGRKQKHARVPAGRQAGNGRRAVLGHDRDL